MAASVRLSMSNGIKVELPAHVQPGQHDRVLSMALGYGVWGTDRFAKIGPQWLESRPTVGQHELVGKNVSQFIEFRDGTMQAVTKERQIRKDQGPARTRVDAAISFA